MNGSQQLSKREFEKEHVAGQLKTGEHRLNDREYAIVKGLVDSHMDRDRGEHKSIFYSPRGGVTKDEIEEIAETLEKNHANYGLSKSQVSHVKETLLKHVK